MTKLARWQEEYIVRLKSLNNADLFEKMVQALKDDYNGEFDERYRWRAEVSLLQVRDRLKDWLGE